MPLPVLIVTGGSRGIGAATARLAAARGYAVVVNFVREATAADTVVDDIRRAGGQAAAVQADVGEERDVIRLFDEATALGPIRGLVNNAGILETQMRVADMDPARLHRVLRVNVVGAFLCAREAVRRMSTDARRRRRCHRERVLGGLATRFARRVRGLRGVQGRHRYA